MKVKTVYYDDPLNDEFSGTKIKRLPLPKKFKFVHKNPLWRACSWFVYFVLAVPILWVVAKLGWGVKIYGRKNLKLLKHQGVFLYGNHTQIVDGWSGQCFGLRGKRAYVVANMDSMSLKGLRNFILMLGCLPIPDQSEYLGAFKEAIKTRYAQRAGIIIFPEAHIWPYSTHIRPFGDESFVYPAELGAPVLAMAATYRPRKIFKNLKPKMTLHLSTPIYPDMSKSLAERRQLLRDQVYEFLLHHAAEDENVECVRYVKRPDSASPKA
jgi:1-acyl-sn-glycerol-3-phosphate acyltransferase